ncbi:MAG TPA: hypothetical protein V6C91_20045 [Coleofasciculaceae cyanobacterium]
MSEDSSEVVNVKNKPVFGRGTASATSQPCLNINIAVSLLETVKLFLDKR